MQPGVVGHPNTTPRLTRGPVHREIKRPSHTMIVSKSDPGVTAVSMSLCLPIRPAVGPYALTVG